MSAAITDHCATMVKTQLAVKMLVLVAAGMLAAPHVTAFRSRVYTHRTEMPVCT